MHILFMYYITAKNDIKVQNLFLTCKLVIFLNTDIYVKEFSLTTIAGDHCGTLGMHMRVTYDPQSLICNSS